MFRVEVKHLKTLRQNQLILQKNQCQIKPFNKELYLVWCILQSQKLLELLNIYLSRKFGKTYQHTK